MQAGAACGKHEFPGASAVFAHRRSQMVGAVGSLWLRSAGGIPEMDVARSLCASCVLPAALALLSEVCSKHRNEKLVELSTVKWGVGKSSCLVFCRRGGMGLVTSWHPSPQCGGETCQMVHKYSEV